MSSVIRWCDDCEKAHHFPRDLAPQERDSNWQIALDTIGGLLLGAGVVIGLVWWWTL